MHLLLCSAGLDALPAWLSSLPGSPPTIVFVDVAAEPLQERLRAFAPRFDLRPLADDRAFLLVDSQVREVGSAE